MKKISAEWAEKAEGDFKVAVKESEADEEVERSRLVTLVSSAPQMLPSPTPH